jgi:threonine/homoserine/homoserine lactone efflux protein
LPVHRTTLGSVADLHAGYRSTDKHPTTGVRSAVLLSVEVGAAVWGASATLGLGIGVGLGAAVPPGPVNLEIGRRTVKGGMGAGLAVGLGAVTVDVILAALMGLGVLRAMNAIEPLRIALSAAGVVLLAFLGVQAWRGFGRILRDRRGPQIESAGTISARTGYVTGVLLCATSPYQAMFWLTAVPAVVEELPAMGEGRAGLQVVLLCLGVMAGTLAWVVFFSSLGAWLSRRLGWWLPAGMDALGGTLLLGFALLAGVGLIRGG